MVIEIFVMANVVGTQIKKNNELILLKDLPAGLRGKLTSALKMLDSSQIVVNTGEVEKSILVLVGQNKILSEVEGQAGEKMKEALKLLVWYYGQHFYSFSPGLIGGDIHCSTCKSIQSPGYGSQYCESPSCSSHIMWKQIIGTSYKIPRAKKMKIHIQRADPGLSPKQVRDLKKEVRQLVESKKKQSAGVVK